MYDFSNFIDILNNFENKMVAVKNAIDVRCKNDKDYCNENSLL